MNELLKRKLPLHDFPVSNRRSTDQQTDGRTRPHLENNVTLRPDNGLEGSNSHEDRKIKPRKQWRLGRTYQPNPQRLTHPQRKHVDVFENE